jgi:TonB family protein
MKIKFLLAALFCVTMGFAQLVPHTYSFNVENFPDVYGGKEEWKRFLRDHLVYPEEDMKKKTEGTVEVYFVVTRDGRSARAKVTKSVSPGLDHEALRLLSMLDWFPSKQGDSLINVEHSIQIDFSVSRYKKWVKQRGFEKAAYTDLPLDTNFTVYESADKAPGFADPDKTFPEFVGANLEYPVVARQQGLEGTVTMSFVIEPDGRVSNIRIKKGVGGGCNEEAIRVIALTHWKPAQKSGKYVRFRMYYSMLFKVQNTFKDNASGSQRVGGQ